MIFKVQNLGYIEEAEVDLSKDLIIFTGQNNTGKTYLAYAVYHLLKIEGAIIEKWLKLSYSDSELPSAIINYGKSYIENGKVEVNYKDFFPIIDIVESYIFKFLKESINEHFQDISKYVFSSERTFHNCKFSIEKLNIEKLFSIFSLKNNSSQIFTKNHFGSVYNKNSSDIGHKILKYFSVSLLTIIFDKRIYIAPAERNAINIFSKELSLAKSKIFKNYNGSGLIKDAQFVNRYPKPIQDNLEIAEDLAFLSRHKSEFEYLAIELEQDFIKGKISTNQYGQIEYSPDNQKDINLEIHLTASMVKSLSNIVFYLRHLAQKGDCIIIDEPELNLHPDNQRKIARFIGRLINEGFQVVISTHSDYIIKELNNMIMLSKAKDNQELVEKLGFRGDELVKPEQVQALLFTLDSRKPSTIEVTEEGFSVKTIDETIAKQDALTEEIYYQLFEQEPV